MMMNDMMMEDISASTSSCNLHAAANLNNYPSKPQVADEDDLLALLGSDTFSLESSRDKDLLLLSSILKGVIPGERPLMGIGLTPTSTNRNSQFQHQSQSQLPPSQNSTNVKTEDGSSFYTPSQTTRAQHGNGYSNNNVRNGVMDVNQRNGMTMETQTPHGTPFAVNYQTLQPPPPPHQFIPSSGQFTSQPQSQPVLCSPPSSSSSTGPTLGFSNPSPSLQPSGNLPGTAAPPPTPLSSISLSSSPHSQSLLLAQQQQQRYQHQQQHQQQHQNQQSNYQSNASSTESPTLPPIGRPWFSGVSNPSSSGIRAPAASRERDFPRNAYGSGLGSDLGALAFVSDSMESSEEMGVKYEGQQSIEGGSSWLSSGHSLRGRQQPQQPQ